MICMDNIGHECGHAMDMQFRWSFVMVIQRPVAQGTVDAESYTPILG